MTILPHQQEEQGLRSCKTPQFDAGFPLQEPKPILKKSKQLESKFEKIEAQKDIGLENNLSPGQ